jgi:hypothetical protein
MILVFVHVDKHALEAIFVKNLFALLTLSASFSLFLAGSLSAQTFRNPYRIPTTQDPISVFVVDLNRDGVPDLFYETESNSTTRGSIGFIFGQSSSGYIAGPTLTLRSKTLLQKAGSGWMIQLPFFNSISGFES